MKTRKVLAERTARPAPGANGHSVAQDEFAFVVHLPGPRVVAARVVQRLRGKGPVAPPPVRYCEMKPSLLVREAAQDLGVSEKTVENMLDDGTLRAFAIGRGALRDHKRVDSASVVELIASAWKGAVTQPPHDP